MTSTVNGHIGSTFPPTHAPGPLRASSHPPTSPSTVSPRASITGNKPTKGSKHSAMPETALTAAKKASSSSAPTSTHAA